MIATILLIIVVYLFQVNTSISYSLQMKQDESRLKDLNLENEHLIKQVTQIGSMANIYLVVQSLKMVKANTADYLILTDEILAER